MFANFIKQEFTRNVLTKMVALVAMPVLNQFKKRVDHRRYNGVQHCSVCVDSFSKAMARPMPSRLRMPSIGLMMRPVIVC